MLNTIKNTPSFQADLAAHKAGKGQKGLHLGSDFLKDACLPLTKYLLELWKANPNDSSELSIAKTVARGLTCFFTAITGGPIYQSLYGIPHTLLFARTNTQYAKATLEALSSYNTLRNQIIRDGDHTRRYLAPENIEARSKEIH